ncbi:ESX secretion-associated protein EspG [Nocardia rhamnosiphila]|uniref:ESX secretion-associated protein EspG n=1 Tax=Nocardia rhamnosiphila TaxID=426716 RepID=UPI0004C43784|nr:ESX secretion-associated protein EspG [Nocardia rhamnosiphila]
MKWEFTPDEFMHVWKETGKDRYPYPLEVRSSVRWEDEFQRLAAGIASSYPRGGDPDLTAALRVAADPEYTLTLSGSRRHRIRAYGAFAGQVAVTVVQFPGTTTDFDGKFVLQIGSSSLVSRIFLQILGEQPTGSRAPLVESIDRLRDTYEVWNGGKPQPADRMRRLLKAPRAGSGFLEARHRLREADPPPPRYLSWFDVADDGRYIYRHRYQDFHIDPISHAELSREIDRLASTGHD